MVAIVGSLDGGSVPLLLGQLVPILEEGARVVLDFDGVDYVSSAGWGTFLHALSHGEARQARILFCRMRPEIRRTFELLKLHTVFEVFEFVDQAINAASENLT